MPPKSLKKKLAATTSSNLQAEFPKVREFFETNERLFQLQMNKFNKPPVTQEGDFEQLFELFQQTTKQLSELLDEKKHNQVVVKKIFSGVSTSPKEMGQVLQHDMAIIFEKPSTRTTLTEKYEELLWQRVIATPPEKAPFFTSLTAHESARRRVAELLFATNKVDAAITLLQELIGPPICSSEEVYQKSITLLFKCYKNVLEAAIDKANKAKIAQLLPLIEDCQQKLHAKKIITANHFFILGTIYSHVLQFDRNPHYNFTGIMHFEEAIKLAGKGHSYATALGSLYSEACFLVGKSYLLGIKDRLVPNIEKAKTYLALSNELDAYFYLESLSPQTSGDSKNNSRKPNEEEIFKSANQKNERSCLYMLKICVSLHAGDANFAKYMSYLPTWIDTVKQSRYKPFLDSPLIQQQLARLQFESSNPEWAQILRPPLEFVAEKHLTTDAKVERKFITAKPFPIKQIGTKIAETLKELETATDFFVCLARSVKKSIAFRYALMEYLPQLKDLWDQLLLHWQLIQPNADQIKEMTSLFISLNCLGISTKIVALNKLLSHLAGQLVVDPLKDKNRVALVIYHLCIGQALHTPADFRMLFLLLEQVKTAWSTLTTKSRCLLFYSLYVLHAQANTSGVYRASLFTTVMEFAKSLDRAGCLASSYDKEDQETPIIVMQAACAYEYFTHLSEQNVNPAKLKPIYTYYQNLKALGFNYQLKINSSHEQLQLWQLFLAFCPDVISEYCIADGSTIVVDYFFKKGKIIGQYDPLQHFLVDDEQKQIPAPSTVARDRICELRGFKKIIIFTPEELTQYHSGHWDVLIRFFCFLQKKLAPYRKLTLQEFDPQRIAPLEGEEKKQSFSVKTVAVPPTYDKPRFFKFSPETQSMGFVADSEQAIAICLLKLQQNLVPEVLADCNAFYQQATAEKNELALDYLLQQLQIKIKTLPEVDVDSGSCLIWVRPR